MMEAGQVFSADMIIQYSIVGLILLAACLWIVWKLVRKHKSNQGCCGCAISDSCKKAKKHTQRR